jgi:peptidoglycan/LPS O-acetylase OafA/YrhL
MICITGILYLFNRFQPEEKIHHNNASAIIISISVFVLTIIIAHFSYRYLETYFIKRKNL